jgi:hypothetical protein
VASTPPVSAPYDLQLLFPSCRVSFALPEEFLTWQVIGVIRFVVSAVWIEIGSGEGVRRRRSIEAGGFEVEIGEGVWR